MKNYRHFQDSSKSIERIYDEYPYSRFLPLTANKSPACRKWKCKPNGNGVSRPIRFSLTRLLHSDHIGLVPNSLNFLVLDFDTDNDYADEVIAALVSRSIAHFVLQSKSGRKHVYLHLRYNKTLTKEFWDREGVEGHIELIYKDFYVVLWDAGFTYDQVKELADSTPIGINTLKELLAGLGWERRLPKPRPKKKTKEKKMKALTKKKRKKRHIDPRLLANARRSDSNTYPMTEKELLSFIRDKKLYKGDRFKRTAYSVACPFHDDRRRSGWYEVSEGLYRCQVCGGLRFHVLDKWWTSKATWNKSEQFDIVKTHAMTLSKQLGYVTIRSIIEFEYRPLGDEKMNLLTTSAKKRIGKYLRELGYERTKKRMGNGVREWVWIYLT